MSKLTAVAVDPASFQNPAIVYLMSLQSKRSPRVMQNALRNMTAIMLNVEPETLDREAELNYAWHELRYQHTQAIRARLMAAFQPATVNRHLSALRGVLKVCWRLGLIDVETFQRAVDFKNTRYEVLPSGRDVPDPELHQILVQCYKDGNKGIRDLAVLGVLATTGMRREELVQLDLADFDPATGCLRLHGKGHKDRTVYVVNKAAECLQAWLAIRGDAPGALFTSVNKGGRVSPSRLPATAIYTMLTARAALAKLVKVTPHDLRRTFVGMMLDQNIDGVTITKITGQADMKMLQRYDRRAERVKREAVMKIDLPL